MLLDGDDLAEKDRRVLRDVVARLAADDDTERSELAGDDGSVGVEIDWLLGRAGRYAETATDVDLGDPMAGGDEACRDAGDPGECRFERGQAVLPEPTRAGVEVDRVNREAVPSRGGQRVRDPVLVDPELRRPLAAVGEAGVVARAGSRVDPEPDRPSRIAPPDALDLADRIEIEVDRRRKQDIEVPLRDIRAGEADRVGRPAALEGSCDLARRARVDPDETAQHLEDTGVRVGLEREPEPMKEACAVQCLGQPSSVLDEPRPVVDEERRPMPAGERLGVFAGDREPTVTHIEAGADPPRRGRQDHPRRVARSGGSQLAVVPCASAGCGWAWRDEPEPGVQRSGPSMISTPSDSSIRREASATSAMAASNASAFRPDGTR